MLADAQHLAQHGAGLFHRLQGAAEHHVIERAIGVMGQIAVGVAMHHRQAACDGAGDLGHVDLDAAGVTVALAGQFVDQLAVAAADVEHARAWGDHFGDQSQIEAHVLGDVAHGFRIFAHVRPACCAQPARKPETMR